MKADFIHNACVAAGKKNIMYYILKTHKDLGLLKGLFSFVKGERLWILHYHRILTLWKAHCIHFLGRP